MISADFRTATSASGRVGLGCVVTWGSRALGPHGGRSSRRRLRDDERARTVVIRVAPRVASDKYRVRISSDDRKQAREGLTGRWPQERSNNRSSPLCSWCRVVVWVFFEAGFGGVPCSDAGRRRIRVAHKPRVPQFVVTCRRESGDLNCGNAVIAGHGRVPAPFRSGGWCSGGSKAVTRAVI